MVHRDRLARKRAAKPVRLGPISRAILSSLFRLTHAPIPAPAAACAVFHLRRIYRKIRLSNPETAGLNLDREVVVDRVVRGPGHRG